MKYILTLDQGTTSSRAILFDHAGTIKAIEQQEFKQIFPQEGWVEHDPNEIWQSQVNVAKKVLEKSGALATDIAAIGITNQRETTIVWDRESGEPVYNAIVWQDRRTAAICDKLRDDGYESLFKEKTGLLIDPYFSGTKLQWILNNVAGAREKAEKGKLAFGTVDSWLINKLTGGGKHITDVTNAARTLMFNIHDGDWDSELLNILDIPEKMMPEVHLSSEIYCETVSDIFGGSIPVAGIAGDQQAALFGQVCTKPGMVKNTYGTGCFLVMYTGETTIPSQHNLLTTIAWQTDRQLHYALEGSVFIAGAAVQWLRDGLKLIESSDQVEKLAKQVKNTGDVYLVPAFTGLGAPYWDPHARGTIVGITRGTNDAHIARATLESIAHQTVDVLEAMEADSGIKITELRVDGGASVNNLLMQIQANLLGVPVIRPKISETTALGAAYLAGLAVGFWNNQNEIASQWQIDRRFEPQIPVAEVKRQRAKWKKAIECTRSWIESDEK